MRGQAVPGAGVFLVSLLGVTLLLTACDDERVAAVDEDRDATGDDQGGDGPPVRDAVVSRDSRVDIDVGRSDSGGRDATGPLRDAEVVELDADPSTLDADPSTLDAAPGPVLPVPRVGAVGVARLSDRNVVAWAIDNALWIRGLDLSGEWLDEALTVGRLPVDIVSVAAVGDNDIAWVAYAGAAVGTRLHPVNLSGRGPVDLPLAGSVHLVSGHGRLLVVGADADGRLSWSLVNPASLPVAPEAPDWTDDGLLPLADDVGVIESGFVLRFASDGWCVQLDTSARPLGSFPCSRGVGRIFGDGVRAWLGAAPAEDDVLRVWPLFREAGPGGFAITGIERDARSDFPNHRGVSLVVGREPAMLEGVQA